MKNLRHSYGVRRQHERDEATSYHKTTTITRSPRNLRMVRLCPDRGTPGMPFCKITYAYEVETDRPKCRADDDRGVERLLGVG